MLLAECRRRESSLKGSNDEVLILKVRWPNPWVARRPGPVPVAPRRLDRWFPASARSGKHYEALAKAHHANGVVTGERMAGQRGRVRLSTA
jgi:hypothetical protein